MKFENIFDLAKKVIFQFWVTDFFLPKLYFFLLYVVTSETKKVPE